MPLNNSLCGTAPEGRWIFKDRVGEMETFELDGMPVYCLLVRNVWRESLKQGDIACWCEFGRTVLKFGHGEQIAGVIMAIQVEPRDLCWLAIKNYGERPTIPGLTPPPNIVGTHDGRTVTNNAGATRLTLTK
jgi:hypothetical protein